ncbi:hypothetical protein BJ875DRAFT_471416 [Amylocarpus encephaloides]|uniref:Pyrroloquinoline quinone-dependent pyranose dehydrogenase beta-propeller domain-containing protein n=1 Tax=Amylocarpus encephaloides TaxID=45428 RepID=A0A9P7YC37_9HELO|nr:hypothetical protein BJ875DRAFT_471416 [Amylocarpus encephaloides]
MQSIINRQVFLILTALLKLGTSQSVSCTLRPAYPAPVLSNGWSGQLIYDDLDGPRGIVFDTSGNLLVVEQGEGIVHISLNDGGTTCLNVANKRDVIDNDSLNHGIALSVDGRTLYASSSDAVYSWAYDPATGTVSGANQTLVTGMQNGGHTTRTLMMSQKYPGMLVVSRGSDGNIDIAATTLEYGHSQIRAFNVSNLTSTSPPYDFTTQGRRLGWGLRNSVGIAEEPTSGGIYSVENSADNMRRNGVEIRENNPGEELNFHGSLNETAEGDNYGYPNCFALWNPEIPDVGTLTVGSQFALEQNSTVNDAFCNEERVAPRLTFQAHTAPLDIVFQPNGSEAYVSFHGSWNRDDPSGYTISSIPFSKGSPTAPANSSNSSRVIMANPENSRCPNACFRPVGLALDGAGRIFFTSDSTGELWVMAKTSGDTPTPSTTTSGTASPSATRENKGVRAVSIGLWMYGLIMVGLALVL